MSDQLTPISDKALAHLKTVLPGMLYTGPRSDDGGIIRALQLIARLDKAEAEVARLRAALESIVERHPDSTRGEHPAVDICLDALTGIDQRYPFHALAAPPDPKENDVR